MKRVTRNRVRVSYHEPEEPSFDENVFCSRCGDYVYEYCSIHGPLLVIPDVEVPAGRPSLVPRAALTIPRTFLHLAPSTIPDAGIGVFSTLTLPSGVRFGPYRGLKTEDSSSDYCWQIFDRDHKPAHVLDARDPNKSNWLRYVNCSRHYTEQNLVAYQYYGQLYYRTIKIIPRFTELLVFYGSEFARELDIDVRQYHAPVYAEILVNAEYGAQKHDTHNKVNEDAFTVDAKDGSHNSVTQELTDVSTFDTETPGSSVIKLNDLNKNIDQYEDQNVNCDSDIVKTLQSFNEKAVTTQHANIHNGAKNDDKNTNKTRIYLCLDCNYKFVTKSQLINHAIQVHDSKIKYKACSQCDYKTLHSSHLKAHMETHDRQAQKPVHCQTCDSKFKDIDKLTIHSKMHDADRLFACPICKHRFKTNFDLKRHLEIHSEVKPFTCVICNKGFRQKYLLTRHVKLHIIYLSTTACDIGTSKDAC